MGMDRYSVCACYTYTSIFVPDFNIQLTIVLLNCKNVKLSESYV